MTISNARSLFVRFFPLAAVWLLTGAISVAAVSGHPLRAEEILAAKNIIGVRPSPDGRVVVLSVVSAELATNRLITRLMQISAAGGAASAVKGAPENAASVVWSPDGTRLAFFTDKQLWVLHVAKGRLTKVCNYARGNGYLAHAGSLLEWSPDSKQLVFAGTLEAAPAAQDPLVITRILYKTRTALSDNRRSHLYVVPASGGTPRALTEGNHDEHSIAWGGDGRQVLFLSNHESDPDARLNYDLFAVDVSTRAIRQLTRTPGVEMDPHVSPDGKWVAYTATKRPLTTIDSIAEDAHLWVLPLTAVGRSAARELNAPLDRRTFAHTWTPDSQALVFSVADHGKTVFYRVPVDGGDSVRLVDRNAQAALPAFAGKDLVFTMTDPANPPEVYRLDVGASEPRRLTSLHTAATASWSLSAPETVSFPTFDDAYQMGAKSAGPIEGWLYPALNASLNGGRSPLILAIHGGPHGSHGYAFNAVYQFYAGRGYAVLAINPRGSSGYGQKFSDGCVNDWGGGDYRDLMAGVDQVLKTHPNLDANRLGVTGSSYGGYMTNWVIGQTRRFKSAVAAASLSDLVSFYATSLYQDLVHAEFGFPWDEGVSKRLWQRSPLGYLKNITTPTLFLHGEQDNDVHITQAEQMYTGLRERGVESALVRYPREGHGFTEPKHRVDAAVRTIEWMDRYLREPVRK